MAGSRRFIRRRYLALILLALTGACASFVSKTVLPPSPEPACILQPQPTGERIVRPTIESPPPAKARPGETLRIRFSGGYVAFNNARVCGGELVGYVYSDALPTPQIIRRVVILLDERELTAVDCPNAECELEFVIPADVSPGRHELVILTPWAIETNFDIEITG